MRILDGWEKGLICLKMLCNEIKIDDLSRLRNNNTDNTCKYCGKERIAREMLKKFSTYR